MKKLYIETLGCAMNERDSEHIIAELSQKEDFTLTSTLEEADLILINTCSVREKPVAKLFSEIGVFNKKRKDGAKIGVCGCTASHLGEEIIKRAPVVDFVLGARNVSKITEVLHKKGAVEVDVNYDESSFAFGDFRNSLYKAMINISIGCDKQCTYCIVPHTRGKEVAIPSKLIVQEARKAAQSGAKEIMLLGQNVNSYDDEGRDFSDLLEMVSEIDEVERIRFTSPHPLHMDDKFLDVFANNPKVCKNMHMPLQSGSTRVLKEMKRGYTKEWFLDRAFKLREMVPDVRISTDIIVAFPSESEEEFLETLDVMEQVRFEQIFSFKYSPRPLTKAAQFTNQIPKDIADERLSRLQNLYNTILDEVTDATKGEIFEVYFEELKSGGKVSGRSDNGFMISVEGSEELLGKTKEVLIEYPRRTTLYGKVIN